ncbi:MAG: hypothetical protein GX640_19985 [Fibrobacter sp.]|nr:hypothetical protein [Fibrobacter sp.]
MKKEATKPKESQYKHISPETASFIDGVKELSKKFTTKKDSREFLVSAGFYTKTGSLNKAYR